MKCPKCGEEIDHEYGDVCIYTIGEKQIKIWHLNCDGKWVYNRKG